MKFAQMGLLIRRLFILFAFGLTSGVNAKKVERIVALSPHSVEMLYAIGAGDKIVGTVEYADYPAAAQKIPRIGNYNGIQIERLLALKPDLVIAWKNGNKSTDLEKMASLGLNMLYTQPKNIKDIGIDLIRLGEATGNLKQSQLLVKELQEKHQTIKQNYAALDKVSVFYQLWHDPLQSIGPNSWIESLINDCGGENIFHSASAPYPLVSIESVLVKNPKVIIIPHHSGSEADKKAIWNSWPEISAVKNHYLFALNGDLLHRFTPRALDGLKLLCEKIDSARTK